MARKSNAQGQIPTGKQDTPYIDMTKLVQGVFARGAEMQAGSVAGTGAPIVVNLDFDPALVVFVNDTISSVGIKHPGALTDRGITVGPGGAGEGAGVATLGALGEKKFTIGASVAVNNVADVLHWIAFGFSATGGE